MSKQKIRLHFLLQKLVCSYMFLFLLLIYLHVATRQLEALFNLSQLLFGLARSEQSNYTFRDLQLGHPLRSFRDQLTFFQSFNFLLMIYSNPVLLMLSL